MPTGIYTRTAEHSRRISEALVGLKKKTSTYRGDRHHRWKGGRPLCIDCPRQLSTYKKGGRCLICSRRYASGERSPHWKGGITPENKKRRNSHEYKLWRLAVFERDKYTCQDCGVSGVYLEADHIKPWSLFPDSRLDISNGRTLCVQCHKLTPTYKGRIKRYA